MNNCPKCGNPLAPGVTICPICGTNTRSTINNQPVQPAQQVQPKIEPIAPSVQNHQAVTSVPNQQTVNISSQPVQNTQSIQNTVVPAQPLTTKPLPNQQPPISNGVIATPPVQTPSNPLPQNTIKSDQVNNTVTNANNFRASTLEPQPSITPNINPQRTVNIQQPPTTFTQTPTQITPNLNSMTPVNQTQQPVSNIRSSTTTKTVSEPKDKKTKKNLKLNKNTLIIIVAVVIIAIFMIFALNNNKNKSNGANNNNPDDNSQTPTIVKKDVITSGFKYKLEDGWLVQNAGTNVIIKNAKENVIIKLEQYAYNLSTLNKDNISSYLTSDTTVEDLTVDETQIGGKSSYLINAKISETQSTDSNKYNVQYYLINGGPELTLGATVIYLSNEAKTTYEGTVVTLLGSLSYSDGSQKALESIETYYEAFNLFSRIIRNSNYQEQNIDTNTSSEIDANNDPEINNEIE